MASENDIQQFVHNLEEGSWAGWIKFAAFLIFTLAVASAYFFWDFVGFSNPRAMEQGQIARAIASGHGFTTNELRPAALAQIQHKKGDFPDGEVPDTYQAPLHPLVLAPFLLLTKKDWKMTINDLIYVNDRMIIVVDMLCFILAVGVIFLILRRLFDVRLATMGCLMLILCDRLWQFSTSGLPQMLMLLLFSIATYLLARAIEAQEAGNRPLSWLMGCAVAFGLLGLAHPMTFFIFGACLFFVALYFRPWWLAPILMTAIVGGDVPALDDPKLSCLRLSARHRVSVHPRWRPRQRGFDHARLYRRLRRHPALFFPLQGDEQHRFPGGEPLYLSRGHAHGAILRGRAVAPLPPPRDGSFQMGGAGDVAGGDSRHVHV
ncbi:MAG: glycosyltransferase family 39 protein [Chthoniobacteraceae bacterium]